MSLQRFVQGRLKRVAVDFAREKQVGGESHGVFGAVVEAKKVVNRCQVEEGIHAALLA